jgi:hypothetical protein
MSSARQMDALTNNANRSATHAQDNVHADRSPIVLSPSVVRDAASVAPTHRRLIINGTIVSEPLAQFAYGDSAAFLRTDRLSPDLLSRTRIVARRAENVTSSDVLTALLGRIVPVIQRECRGRATHPTDFIRTFAVVIDPSGAVLSAAPTEFRETPPTPANRHENDFSRCVERAMTSTQLPPVSVTHPILEIVPPVSAPLICWWPTPSCTSTVDTLLVAAARAL